MDELTNQEKTVLAHLNIHHRIQPGEPAMVKIFGGDQAERRKVLTSLRDRGYIRHFKFARDDIQFIIPSEKGAPIGASLCAAARQGSWAPENITLGE